jgi:23S rRNA (adenine2503-C2)-methyltransferase
LLAISRLDMPITLSISLHASRDEERSEIMPVNRRWSVGELLEACRDYYKTTGRRLSFEYTLISGKNDTADQAEHLAKTLNGALRTRTETMPIHVNLIRVNEVKETGFKEGTRESVDRFAKTLERFGVTATVRRRLGSDVNAACGQLRKNAIERG